MKYGNTSRSLSVLFHGLIAACGLALTLYFGFFLIPNQFLNELAWIDISLAANLKLELAVIGLTLTLISGYGLVYGLKSLANPSDDKPVLKAFGAFIADGYVSALFFLLNATIFYDLTLGEDASPAFVIIVAIVLCIGLLIAANIPMVRVFDGKRAPGMYKGLAYAFAVNAFSITLFSALLLLSLLLRGSSSSFNERIVMLLIYIAFSALTGVFCILSAKFLGKEPKHLSGLFSALGFLVAGGGFVGVGAAELAWNSLPVHLSETSYTIGSVNPFGIACVVLGGVILVVSIVVLVLNYKEPSSKPVHKA